MQSKLPINASLTTIDAVRDFFSALAPVLSVKVNKQRADKNMPCGTAYVTFAEVSDKDKVLAMGAWKFGEADLKVKDKAAADAKFREEKAEKAAKKASGGAQSVDGAAAAPSAPAWERGLIVKLTKYGTPTLDELKAKFGEYGFVKFVDNPQAGDADKPCFVRFAEADKANAALAAVEAKAVQFGDVTVEGTLLTGDDEEEYWVKNIINAKPKGDGRRGGGRGGRRGGGRGGRGGRRGGR